MKKIILIALSLVVLCTSCIKNKHDNRPLLTTQYNYELTITSDRISKIVTRSGSVLLNQEYIAKKNDTTYLSILTDTYAETIEKKYFYVNSQNLAYLSIDSIKNDNIITTIEYQYTPEKYNISNNLVADIYDESFSEVLYHVVGNTSNTIENGNVVKTEIKRTYSGNSNFDEKEIYEFYFTDLINKDGIQYFSQKFTGNPNTNLIDSVSYHYYKNDVLIKSGKFTYTYSIDEETKRVLKETEYYRSDSPEYNDVKTINNYSYIYQ